MLQKNRPFLIVPKLIEQPTWGGDYILRLKNWLGKKDFLNLKIGQSYELFSDTKLLLNINSSQDNGFNGELGTADETKIFNKTGYAEGKDYVNLREVTSLYDKIPLIKINQSYGNSFQIHIKKSDGRWLPKMESSYFLEDGVITFGIKKGISVDDYKNACLKIDKKMNELSVRIKKGNISVAEARKAAKSFIAEVDPWQYVNIHIVKKGSIVPGLPGVHHSWEEDVRFSHGVINYEIQQNVMDPASTIRSFDKGKIKDDGSIRKIHIEDYFKYLDTDPIHNNLQKMTPKKQGNRLLTTEFYCLDILEVNDEIIDLTRDSFAHLFVREGKVLVESESKEKIFLTKGFSCFIPETVGRYKIKPFEKGSVVLKAFIK